jgi:hypothetical protein
MFHEAAAGRRHRPRRRAGERVCSVTLSAFLFIVLAGGLELLRGCVLAARLGGLGLLPDGDESTPGGWLKIRALLDRRLQQTRSIPARGSGP